MSLTDSKRKANDKYIKSHYERIPISYPIGTKERWKEEALKRGLSLAEFVRQSVEKAIQETETGCNDGD